MEIGILDATQGKPNGTRVVVAAGLLLVAAAAVGAAMAAFGPEAAAGLIGVVLFVATLRSPLIGLVAMALLIPIEAAIVDAGGDMLVKALLILIVLAWLFRKILKRESFLPVVTSPFVVLAILFLALAVTSVTWAMYSEGVNAQLARLASVIALGIVAADLGRDWDNIDVLARALVIGALAAAVLTVVQYYGIGGMRRAGRDVAGGINATAMLFVSVVPFGFYLLRGADKLVWRVLGLVYVGATLFAVAVTFSRMSMLVLPVLLLVELVAILRRRNGFVVALLLIALLPLAWFVLPMDEITERAATIGPYVEQTFGRGDPGITRLSSRGFHLKVATEVFAEHPIVGVGYGNFGRFFLQYQLDVPGSAYLYRTPRSAHSSYFAMLADLGLLGIGLFVAIVVVSGLGVWKAARRLKPPGTSRQLVARALVLCLLAQATYGFYAELHRDKFFWLILGLCSAAGALAAHRVGAQRDTADRVGSSPRPPTAELPADVIPIHGSR